MPAEPFSDADLARLEARLDEPPLRDTAATADALQGMFVALAIGPQEAEPADWLESALGVEPARADEEMIDLLTRFYEHTACRAREGRLALLLYSLRRGRADYTTWGRGFLGGLDASPVDWYDVADPDDLDELLLPIRVLADDLTDVERASYTPAAWRKLVLESETGLEQAIVRLRDYWAIVRSPPQTVRREVPKPGRNAPCPCGSGRKYKHCCGR
ncbi:MAG TPA: UPF0149 family protein [Casimicrobiaceae bacterium]|jgi:yecA family protein